MKKDKSKKTVEEFLYQQLKLLAKKSKEASSIEDICNISSAMTNIVHAFYLS